MMIGTKPWFDEHRAGRATLAQRAAFDLGCQAEQLQFTCLGPNSNCNTVGASGCEKKATYVFTGSEWVMNSTRQ